MIVDDDVAVLQLRMVPRPMKTPLPTSMPRLSVPFASRQQLSSIATSSPMRILCGCRRTTLTPKVTLRPTRPSSNGYSFDRSNSPRAPGNALTAVTISSYLTSAQSPGRPTTSAAYRAAFDRPGSNSFS